MQHHGAPTRLQDWTYSPYVATLFAVEKAFSRNGTCAVWSIEIEWCKWAALEILRETQWEMDLLISDENSRTANLQSDAYFENVYLKNRAPLVVPMQPFRMNERNMIQQGAFLCPGTVNDSFIDNLKAMESKGLKEHLKKYVIPNKQRTTIIDDLYRMNVTRATLFPGLDGFAQSLTGKVCPSGIGELSAKRKKAAEKHNS